MNQLSAITRKRRDELLAGNVGISIEYYHYDQLGSFMSDKPDEPELWEIDRLQEWTENSRPR